jgi:mono/diheme cytochrome c family protein
MPLRILIPCLALALTACEPVPPPRVPPAPALAAQGQSRAEALCGGCHAVGRDGASTHPNAPPFHAVINQVDLRTETVSAWLRDAHNYPSEMRFSLSESEVEALVAYMLTLRDPNYRRPPD